MRSVRIIMASHLWNLVVYLALLPSPFAPVTAQTARQERLVTAQACKRRSNVILLRRDELMLPRPAPDIGSVGRSSTLAVRQKKFAKGRR